MRGVVKCITSWQQLKEFHLYLVGLVERRQIIIAAIKGYLKQEKNIFLVRLHTSNVQYNELNNLSLGVCRSCFSSQFSGNRYLHCQIFILTNTAFEGNELRISDCYTTLCNILPTWSR